MNNAINRAVATATLGVAATLALPTLAGAQTMLKWAHVYETSEPYHICAVAASRST